MAEPRPIAFVGARLVDPASGYDGPGAVSLCAEKSGRADGPGRGPGRRAGRAQTGPGRADRAELWPGRADQRSRGAFAEVVQRPALEGLSADIELVDCGGAMLAPGLVDIRVKTGEPGAETKETLKSAARAAVAGGVTSIVVQPDTDPVVDEPSVVDFILRRARDIGLEQGLSGRRGDQGPWPVEQMAEIGLMREAGCRLR